MDQNTRQIGYTRAGLPECEVSTMSGPPTGDNTGHTLSPSIGIKIPDPTGNRTRLAELEGSDSTDYATATDPEPLIITKMCSSL